DHEGGRRLWALEVSPEVNFRHCSNISCPPERGFCRAGLSGSAGSGVVLRCMCHYGFAGEGCAQRIGSVASLVWQAVLLVGSNLAVVPSVLLAVRKGPPAAGPAATLTLNGVWSALYHLCDLEVTCAAGVLDYRALQALDFFFSFLSVAAIAVYLCPIAWDTWDSAVTLSRRLQQPRWRLLASTHGETSSVTVGGRQHGRVREDAGDTRGQAPPRSRTAAREALQLNSSCGEVGEGNSEVGVGPGMASARHAHAHAPSSPVSPGCDSGNPESMPQSRGSYLTAVYVIFIPPLLAGVVDGPTQASNLGLMFVLCAVLLSISW
ncbi:unnamed protein product, partial [Discosporangium mesarthrocarpum]